MRALSCIVRTDSIKTSLFGLYLLNLFVFIYDLLPEWCEQAGDWWHWAACLAQFWLSEKWPAPLTSVETKIFLEQKKTWRNRLIKCIWKSTCVYLTCWAVCTCWTTCVGTPVWTTAGGGLESDTLSLEWREPSGRQEARTPTCQSVSI